MITHPKKPTPTLAIHIHAQKFSGDIFLHFPHWNSIYTYLFCGITEMTALMTRKGLPTSDVSRAKTRLRGCAHWD